MTHCNTVTVTKHDKMSFIRSEYDVFGEMMKSSPGCCIVCARKVLEVNGKGFTMRLGRLNYFRGNARDCG